MPLGRPISLTENVASKIVSVTATAGQTNFTVNGGYRVNALSVYRNGVRLNQSTDFTANDGSTVKLTNGAVNGDTLQFQIFDDFAVSDAIQSTSSDQTLSGNLTITGTLDVEGTAANKTASVGIDSGGTNIGVAKTLNFIGTGNTFLDQGDGTIDISISGSSGSGGGGLGTAINYDSAGTPSPFSYIDNYVAVTENMMLDTSAAGVSTSYVVTVVPNIEIKSGIAVTVGVGKTMIIDVLQIGDL